jgi:nucleotide sugar dehydrogenase
MTENVCVLGLGNIGLPVAKHIAQHYPVIGYDINPQAVLLAIENGISAFNQLPNDDIYVITVNTWFRKGQPDMSAIHDCCQQISTINPKALICFESTLSVGTARMATTYDLSLAAVCPHRWWQHDEQNYGVKQQRVLGAFNAASMHKARDFYHTLNIPIHPVSSLEIAELSKIVENANTFYRSAFAQEVKMMCDANSIDFHELRQASNTKWNIELYEARDGIGGECLPKDTQFLIDFSQNTTHLLKAAIHANDHYHQSVKSLK